MSIQLNETQAREWINTHSWRGECTAYLNLDDMAYEDLVEFRHIFQDGASLLAEILWPNELYGDSVQAGNLYLLYAKYKLDAITDRLEGYIERTIKWERECDRYYDRLPDFARW